MLSFLKEETRIILIGTSCCSVKESGIPDLLSVEKNLLRLEEIFCDEKFIGIDKEQILCLHNRTLTYVAPQVANWAKEASDTLFFYYAGHGHIPNPRDGLFLTVEDTTKSNFIHNGWSMSSLHACLANSPAKKKIVIIDCCYSERAIQDGSQWMSVDANVSDPMLYIVDVKGTYSIASSTVNEPSLAKSEEGFTAFTDKLIKAICEGINNEKPYLTIDEIFKEINKKIKETNKKIRENNKMIEASGGTLHPVIPHPVRAICSDIDSFRFVKNNNLERFRADWNTPIAEAVETTPSLALPLSGGGQAENALKYSKPENEKPPQFRRFFLTLFFISIFVLLTIFTKNYLLAFYCLSFSEPKQQLACKVKLRYNIFFRYIPDWL